MGLKHPCVCECVCVFIYSIYIWHGWPVGPPTPPHNPLVSKPQCYMSSLSKHWPDLTYEKTHFPMYYFLKLVFLIMPFIEILPYLTVTAFIFHRLLTWWLPVGGVCGLCVKAWVGVLHLGAFKEPSANVANCVSFIWSFALSVEWFVLDPSSLPFGVLSLSSFGFVFVFCKYSSEEMWPIL